MTLEEAILKALSEKTNISVMEICSKTRKREVATARQVGYYLYRTVYNSITPLSACGKILFGLNQDHTTVMHAIQKTLHYMEYERNIRILVQEVKERTDQLLPQKHSTMPINDLVEEIKIGLNIVIQNMPYNNCASF